jgi:formate dehydrogenase maturation protein FdhE
MSSNGNCKSPANGLVSSKVGICNICAGEWHKVDPELIECSNSSRSSLLEV